MGQRQMTYSNKTLWPIYRHGSIASPFSTTIPYHQQWFVIKSLLYFYKLIWINNILHSKFKWNDGTATIKKTLKTLTTPPASNSTKWKSCGWTLSTQMPSITLHGTLKSFPTQLIEMMINELSGFGRKLVTVVDPVDPHIKSD